MNEHFIFTFLAIVIGLITAIYWLIKVKSQNASISSLMILWGAFTLLQIVGLMASFSVVGHLSMAVLFVLSFHKLGQVTRETDRKRQKEHLQPLMLDAR